MPHLDEGQLVEYLDAHDGDVPAEAEQHLAACTECRGTLERLRAERTRADEILAGSGPVIGDIPAFERVVERAGRARRPGGSTMRVLALAATAVIVVGVGYAAREFAVRPPTEQPVSVQLRVPDRTAQAPNESLETAPGVQDRGEPVATGAIAQRAQAEEQAGAGGVADAREGRENVPVGPARAADMVGAASRERDAVPALAERAAPAAAPTPAPQPAGEPAAVASVAGRAEDEVARRVSDMVTRWDPIDRDSAERLLGGPVRTVDGLEVVDHALDRTNPAVPSVRTRQTLPGGEMLELVQTAGGADVDQFRAERLDAPADLRQAVVTRSGFSVAARAPVSRDSLAVLLARLVP